MARFKQSNSEQSRLNLLNSSRLSHKRNLANLRERKRMMLINEGFELLRNRLPISELNNDGQFREKSPQSVHSGGESSKSSSTERGQSRLNKSFRLTKVDILRLTIEYIRHLSKILDGTAEQTSANALGLKLKPIQVSKTSKNHRQEYKIRKNYRAKHSEVKRVQKQQQKQQQEQIKNVRQVNRQLFVYMKSELTRDCGLQTNSGYLISWSIGPENVIKHDQSSNQDPRPEIEGQNDLKDSKVWIPKLVAV